MGLKEAVQAAKESAKATQKKRMEEEIKMRQRYAEKRNEWVKNWIAHELEPLLLKAAEKGWVCALVDSAVDSLPDDEDYARCLAAEITCETNLYTKYFQELSCGPGDDSSRKVWKVRIDFVG